MTLSSLELCAGMGGQALGLERAGFSHDALVEIEPIACATLRANRRQWNVLNDDVRSVNGFDFRGVDLIAGGVPCPPFSVAGKQLGDNDDRDLFPAALRIVEAALPRAVLLENVPGLATARFDGYRAGVRERLEGMGYEVFWQAINACNFGVPQLRPRFVLVALFKRFAKHFLWPAPRQERTHVGDVLRDLMSSRGWRGATRWAERANDIAPTLVGGSKKHGGPDLGPTRAKQQWRALGVDGNGIADHAPEADCEVNFVPKLTVRMAARIQGIPDSWTIEGKKTAAYRQVGNAFPPPVAEALGLAVRMALLQGSSRQPYDDEIRTTRLLQA